MKKSIIITIIAHAAGWLFLFSLVSAFVYRIPQREGLAIFFSLPFLLFCCFFLFVFYFNLFLVPALYVRKHYGLYILIVATLFVFAWWLRPFDSLMNSFHNEMRMEPPPLRPFNQDPPHKGPEKNNTDIVSIILFLTVWSLSTAICIVKQWRLTEKRAIEAETEKKNAELSFLKAQINPHFLFNTLNNIYAMANMQHEYTAASILKLSNIMRYVTEDAGEHFVPLASELGFMKDYIDLQKLRLNNKTEVNFSVTGEIPDKQIAPLLLMTFVENAFKYGTSSHETAGIIIRISAGSTNIIFTCTNKLFTQRTQKQSTGIGISNAQKRLQYHYAGKHALAIREEEGFYTVHLTIEV